MADYLRRGLAREAGILIQTCVTTELAREGARRHDTSPLAAILLGRALTAVALMGGLLKVQQRIALKFESNGPIRKLLAESNSKGEVRGYISPRTIDLSSDGPAPGLLGLFGNVGVLSVHKDVGTRELSKGSVALEESDLDANLVNYFARSEQILSAIQTGVAVDKVGSIAVSGGVFVQALPGADETLLRALIDRLQQLPVPELWQQTDDPTGEAMAAVMGDVAYEVLEQHAVSFRCTCSRRRTRRALELLGRDEILSLAEEGEAVVDCHFCHERYVFERKELEQIARSLL